MISRLPLFACACLLVACGNYSNEDLDYQLSLPEPSELEAKLPQALVVEDPAEYYMETRKAITVFNGFVVKTIALIDYVRANTPTSRSGSRRIWGPFPSDDHPGWEIRVVMDKSDQPELPAQLTITYAVGIRPVGERLFTDLLTGTFSKAPGEFQGAGHIEWLVGAARDRAYPVDSDGMAELDSIVVDYDSSRFPRVVHLVITNVIGTATRGGTYHFEGAEDGSGTMTFDWKSATENFSAEMISRWLANGAGRADKRPTLGNLVWINDTDCWGPDTRATYVYRDRAVQKPDASTCVFGDP